MSKLELVELLILVIVALVLSIYYIILAIKNGWIKKITLTINESVKYAEENIKGGNEKKKYVLNQVQRKCDELGIPFTFIRNLVSKIIDKIISNYNIIEK